MMDVSLRLVTLLTVAKLDLETGIAWVSGYGYSWLKYISFLHNKLGCIVH